MALLADLTAKALVALPTHHPPKELSHSTWNTKKVANYFSVICVLCLECQKLPILPAFLLAKIQIHRSCQGFIRPLFDTINMIQFNPPERANLVTTMQKLHSIRLRGPWQFFLYKTDGSFDQVRQPLEQELPMGWREGAHELTAKRKFNCPRNLLPSQRVMLQIQSISDLGEIQLNDDALTALENPEIKLPETKRRVAFDGITSYYNISTYLEPFNELRIDFSPGQIDPFTGLGPIRRVDLLIGE